jgi:nucleotide-binding universal stress UspA family protein
LIDIRRILCPIDYSDHSRRALDHAVAIARWYGSTVTVFHVTAVLPVTAYAPAGPIIPAPVTPDDRAAMLEGLRKFAEGEAVSSGVALEFELAEGNVAAEILLASRSMPSDLLVLGTHGYSGFDRFVLGSVTEKVLRKATCPVLTVPGHAPDAAPVPSALFRRILCAIDFSDCSIRALDYAVSLAKEADAHLTVLSVLDLPLAARTDVDEGIPLPRDLRKYVDDVAKERSSRLKALIPPDAETYCTIDTAVATGTPYREILRVAADQKTELLVMGVRGRGAADLLLFGSTTQHVVRQAVCPVLTIRSPVP